MSMAMNRIKRPATTQIEDEIVVVPIYYWKEGKKRHVDVESMRSEFEDALTTLEEEVSE